MPDGITSHVALRGALARARLAVRLTRKGETAKARKARSEALMCLRLALQLATSERRQAIKGAARSQGCALRGTVARTVEQG